MMLCIFLRNPRCSHILQSFTVGLP